MRSECLRIARRNSRREEKGRGKDTSQCGGHEKIASQAQSTRQAQEQPGLPTPWCSLHPPERRLVGASESFSQGCILRITELHCSGNFHQGLVDAQLLCQETSPKLQRFCHIRQHLTQSSQVQDSCLGPDDLNVSKPVSCFAKEKVRPAAATKFEFPKCVQARALLCETL